jgi:hypothetical protein
MKTIEAEYRDKDEGISRYRVCHHKSRISEGDVFTLRGAGRLNGKYIATSGHDISCKKCPFFVHRGFDRAGFARTVCRMVRVSRNGYSYPFCTKDLRSGILNGNCLIIAKLDAILENI